jgi:hypothetical protein
LKNDSFTVGLGCTGGIEYECESKLTFNLREVVTFHSSNFQIDNKSELPSQRTAHPLTHSRAVSVSDVKDSISSANVTRLRSVLVRAAASVVNHVDAAHGSWLHLVLSDATRRAMQGNVDVPGSAVHAMAEALLEAGIDTALVNAQQKTALDFARAVNLPHKAPIVAALELAAASHSGTTPRSAAKTRIAIEATELPLSSVSTASTAPVSSSSSSSSSSTAAPSEKRSSHHRRPGAVVDQVVAFASGGSADDGGADEAGDAHESDKPRKRVSLQQHDVSRSVLGHQKNSRGGDGEPPPPLPPAADTRVRSKSTSVSGARSQAQRSMSTSTFASAAAAAGAGATKTSDLKRGDRIVPGVDFKLNFAALESRAGSSSSQPPTPTEGSSAQQPRAQTARFVPSLSNLPLPIFRSPGEAQPPITLGLGDLISSPRSHVNLRDENNQPNSSDESGEGPPPLPPQSVSASGSPETTRRTQKQKQHKARREGVSAPSSPRRHK